MNRSFLEVIKEQPIVPYIRESDYAVRQPGWTVPNRKLLDYLLIYIQEGTCEFEIDGVTYTCVEGEFCLIQPNVLCSLKGITRTITPFAHFDLFYQVEREHSFPTKPGLIDLSEYQHLIQPRLNDFTNISIPVKFRLHHNSSYKESLLKMIGLWQNGDVISQLEANHLLEEMILGLLKEFSDLQQEDKSVRPQSLNWITSYFSIHLSEPLSLQDMAKRARLSPSRFSALFKNKFGVSPHQYFLHLRIQHAQELLKQGDYTMEDITQFCGFTDVPHFANAFKRITGLTPGNFRSSHKQEIAPFA
ncbi:AraC family transcriptional regulator [Paenibacillus roseipurpureus]|uniref:AraC family transcriptional regulator n=1 Tax=Paenibacillus roseopurpureus TaxID=2918901 RepID=A0AA96LN20_9BACL|nr:AraC family transcriptional regulator [Paenibacillus sp. MBLB1832]WNR42733.1 AraC family transcriptional regulator [Paenibacillus sp. MBLB1832]